MEKLLRFIAKCQETHIANIRQKKDAAHLSNVAGVTLEGSIPAPEYEGLLSNIDGFIKESRRFKEDSTKIVLEKNSTLRALHSAPIFFFRYLNAQGITRINLKDGVRNYVEFDAHGWQPSIVICIALTAIGNAFYYVHNEFHFTWIHVGICLILPTLMAISFVPKYRRFKRWYKKAVTSPAMLLKDGISLSNDGIKTQITINLDGDTEVCIPKNWYEQTLREMTVLASKVEGIIGWMFAYKADKDYSFSINQNGRFVNTANITIKNSDTNLLLCFIETEHSFIFFLHPEYKDLNKNFVFLEDKIQKQFEEEKEKMFITFEK